MVKLKAYNNETHDALQAIYQQGGGREDLASFSRKPKKRGRLMVVLIIALLLLIAGAAVAGVMVFSPHTKFSGKTISIAITGSKSVSSGDDSVWTITVKNTGSIALKKADVSLQYPDGFQYVSAKPTPSNQFNNSWSLGAIKANGQAEIKLSARIIGDVGSSVPLSATLTYTPANFSSEFQADTSLDIAIITSTLGIAIKATTTAASGQKVSYVVTITNTSATSLERVRVMAEYPSGFTDVTTDPKPSTGATWDTAMLEPGKNVVVTVSGTLAGSPNGVAEFKIRAGVLNTSGDFIVQRETSALIVFLEPTLNITTTLGGKSTALVANAGDSLKLSMAYGNSSDAVFTNVTIGMTYSCKDSDGASVDCVVAETIKSGQVFTRDAKNSALLLWNKDALPDLARLVPNGRGTIDLTLPLKKNLRTLGSGKNFSIVLTPSVKADDAGAGTPFAKTLDPVTIKVNTELRLAVEGRYYSDEGVTLGSGPLPPQVGATTQYRVSWFVTNTMNGAQNVLLKATLPAGVTFVTAEASAGNSITFDSTTRDVRWRIDKIDAGVGQTVPTLVGSFTVSVTPTDADVGKILQLLGATSGTAVDAFTGTTLKMTGDAVTTNLSFDSQAAGKGTVVAAVASNTNTNAAQ